MKAQGTVHKYGDNVDTDVIIPARYLNTSSHKELASHCMEDIDIDFTKKKTYQAEPFPPFIQGIIADGGLINHVTK